MEDLDFTDLLPVVLPGSTQVPQGRHLKSEAISAEAPC